jgi:hypothetical protein
MLGRIGGRWGGDGGAGHVTLAPKRSVCASALSGAGEEVVT